MVRHIATLLLALTVGFVAAQDLPASSPLGKVEQRIGLTDVSVTYSRPVAKGRTIFGGLVPYGEIWRTGANSATRLKVSAPVLFEGLPLPAGEYSLFTIPGKETWTVIVNKNPELRGTGGRKPEEDLFQVIVPVQALQDVVESFTIGFEAVQNDKARMDLQWERTRVSVWLAADATEKALANIAEALAKPDAKANAFSRSAQFCLDRSIDPKGALAWAEKAAAMDKKYWILSTLAQAQAANGQVAKAIGTIKEAIALANADQDASSASAYTERLKEWEAKGR
jgi:tetratricopeptide (TPR) repeat protein